MNEGSYTSAEQDYLSNLTMRDIEDARIRLFGEFPPPEPTYREATFIAERRFMRAQIIRVFQVPVAFFETDIYGLAAFSREGRIDSKIRLKVVGQ